MLWTKEPLASVDVWIFLAKSGSTFPKGQSPERDGLRQQKVDGCLAVLGSSWNQLPVGACCSSFSAMILFFVVPPCQDKQEPNDLRTAKRVVESIEDGLTEEDVAV